MTHASLFSGIGGFDLAAEWAGWKNIFNCEIDSFCRQILKYWFPDAIQHNDVNDTEEFEQYEGHVDVLTAGFPCQPFSGAGLQQGTDDPRYMWPQTFRIVRAVRPAVFIGENVRGLVSWSGGMVFERVCADLESEGFTVIPALLPACGVGAPHRRDRIWFIAIHEQRLIANTKCIRSYKIFTKLQPKKSNGNWASCDGSKWNVAKYPFPNWGNFPTQSAVCSRDDGISYGLDSITFPKWRQESIKAYGNAIVPQVVYQIFQTINEYTLNQNE